MDSKSLFQELMNLIELNTKHVPILSRRYSRTDIESAIKIHPIPDNLISIYSCIDKDAKEHNFRYSLTPGYYLIQLEQIDTFINVFKESRSSWIREIGENRYHEFLRGWEPDMIPFLEDGGGGYICIRTLPNDRSIWYLPKAMDSHKINTNLDRFILTAIECYRQGAYYKDWDNDGVWDTDWEMAREIVKQIDPEIENYSPP